MTDIVSAEVRSRTMSRIRGKDTGIELTVRRLLFSRGFRYALHVRDLPGSPDLVLPKHHAVVFVHGCFWHGHRCELFREPQTNAAFWREKIAGNRERDQRASADLASLGWRVLTIWECAIRGKTRDQLERLGDAAGRWILGDNASGDSAFMLPLAAGALEHGPLRRSGPDSDAARK